MNTKEKEILDDVYRVARGLGKKPGDEFTRSEYLGGGAQFSAGYKTRTKEPVPDEVYFERLRRAIETLGRLPKTQERKRFRLNFSKRRWPTLGALIKDAVSKGIISARSSEKDGLVDEQPRCMSKTLPKEHRDSFQDSRPIPPIPERTKRKRWERTGVAAFPYAPHDESGVVALFSILCGLRKIPWQILEFNRGKGLDAIVYDERRHHELKVELKHILSKSAWNHSVDSVDYVVCWENRWRDFPKPVLELKRLIVE